MNKKWYKLLFKQKEPIHIGKGSYGVLSETRIFIPGWTMWGALVNKYARYIGGTKEDFDKSKELLETISCFFPSFEENGKVQFPSYIDGQFCLGNKLEEDFRAKFTDTYVSTAIDPISQNAKDESLHEIGIILPKPKNAMVDKKLYWVGLLGINNSNDDILSFLEEGLEVVVGGESRYGFGRVELIHKNEVDKEELEFWSLDTEGRLIASKPLSNYMEYCNGALKMGEMEHVIVEANFFKAAPKIKESKICLVPGSKASGSGRLKKGIFYSV
ncbi:MAG: hypothetical protein GX892_15535 [Thermoanaerobacteraceae bacterium]|mgnify:CR=1 FL=1|jgi:hypothetical protein|nr:hypothetical protein [Thermoanaerobacteraceae bacterium]